MSKKPNSKPGAGPRLHFDNEVARCIRQHARAHMKTEVCGVLIGENVNGVVEVRASIEASNAAQAGTHVTFTQDAWETIYRVKDENYPDDRIVGWYHSHPGFGVFLSEHDTFIQRNFFSSPDQVAWVYDPHTDEEGCFGWIDGEIHRIPSYIILDNNGDGVERTPKSSENSRPDIDDESQMKYGDQSRERPPARWLQWTFYALSYLSMLLLGFMVAYLLFPRLVAIPVDPVTGEPLLRLPSARPAITAPPPTSSQTVNPPPADKQGSTK